jgi:sulfite reductase (NADPH) hemoprotein beta-component
MACVALPTCGLALAESERYLPDLVTALEDAIERAGLRDDEIVIRMSGCPNGCSRPYLAEIGLVGRTPGRYNLYLGAAFDGTRLNKLYGKDLDHDEILAALTRLIASYARERLDGERFGDFVIRKGHVAGTTSGADFHANLAPELDAA